MRYNTILFADESINDSDTNTVSLRREISIIDVNDNPPEFLGRPYSFSVLEDTKVGTVIYSSITVVDKDIGPNSDIFMMCLQNNEPCTTFNLLIEKVSEGSYFIIASIIFTTHIGTYFLIYILNIILY